MKYAQATRLIPNLAVLGVGLTAAHPHQDQIHVLQLVHKLAAAVLREPRGL